MTPIDTGAIRDAVDDDPFLAGSTAGRLVVMLCDEIDRLGALVDWQTVMLRAADDMAAENESSRLLAIAEWAADAPHHDGCNARHNEARQPSGLRPYHCKCGRDEVLP